jgi:adenine-specific DNA-methyltransferase
VTKRFTSKEERRRVVAYVVDPEKLPGALYGFENHLNVFHAEKGGLPPQIAYGLATFLNSTVVDKFFRTFSGHTQVNAADLRALRYPSTAKLAALGDWAIRNPMPTQEDIDNAVVVYGH